MIQHYRLENGGRIDRSGPISFTFNGTRYTGYQGDTVASALIANGVRVVARSFKYHRPRGIMGSGAEEPSALLQLETGAYTVPNVRATQQPLYHDLVASSVNCWPSVNFDVNAVTSRFARILPAGFYYKTFMWPQSFWKNFYEDSIRKAAGLGESPAEGDPEHYDKTFAHCDVLVAGAGPAGIAAALAAGRAGARVILADEQHELGGSLLATRDEIGGEPADGWLQAQLSELQRMPEVRKLPCSTVYGYFDHNCLAIQERLSEGMKPGTYEGPRERLWLVRAKQVVLATGAIERPLIFSNNDRPGVMLASAVTSYIVRYGVRPGDAAVVFTNNDSAYRTALDLHCAGVTVTAVVDARPEAEGEWPSRVRKSGIRIMPGHVVVDVQGTKKVEGARVMALSPNGEAVSGSIQGLRCDLLAVSGGWNPTVHLHAQSGARPKWDDSKASFVPGTAVQAERSAGAANGTFRLGECLSEGFQAGAEAARSAGFGDAGTPDSPETNEPVERPMLPLWLVPGPKAPGRLPKQFVDFQNDTGAADLMLAVREGYRSIEHVKRYTLLGFGTDQGKLGNVNGMAIVAKSLGADISSTGTTTFRPAYTPVTFGSIAGHDVGELFEPIRKTALHQWHEEQGAEFENVGQWKRPWYYPKAGETIHDAVNRECRAVRDSVGIMDASTLGKIEIKGPDSAEFLDRMYINGWKKLGIGRARYGFMLGEDGMVLDDGVTIRLAEDHYFMHTTTGGAATVMKWLERWLQTEWPELKVFLTSVTDHWATAAVVGPRSREVVSEVCNGIDLSREAFPFMASRTGNVAGVPARVNRISFSGELAFEVNVPANYGRQVWEELMEAGKAHGITPYGTETMHVLRAEKGYVIVGQDTDGSVTPMDLGMEGMIAKHKDFIGKRSLFREDCQRPDRKQLVGLLTTNPEIVLPEGGQITTDATVPLPVPMIGHVTSSYFSANLGRSIALALVKGGRERLGERVQVPLRDGRIIGAEITDTVFLDPEGERQNA